MKIKPISDHTNLKFGMLDLYNSNKGKSKNEEIHT